MNFLSQVVVTFCPKFTIDVLWRFVQLFLQNWHFVPDIFCPTVKFCPDVPQRPCYPIYISSLEGCIAATNTWTTPSCGAETPPRTCSWLSGMARAIDVSVIVCSPLQVGCHARRKCISGKKCRNLCKNRDISLPWVKMSQRGECISGMKCHN